MVVFLPYFTEGRGAKGEGDLFLLPEGGCGGREILMIRLWKDLNKYLAHADKRRRNMV